jgi:hypothetical protein
MPNNSMPECWIYGGVRVSRTSKRTHLWIDPEDTERYYNDTGWFTIGGIYDVEVTRKDGHVMRTEPLYTGERIDDLERRKALELKDALAKTRLSKLSLERKHRDDNAIETALIPVQELAATLRTRNDRDAFIAIVVRSICDAAWRT